ncbi:MAG: hypothetical protein DRQ62_11170, partial [Gammaproteobacteria bacterium]
GLSVIEHYGYGRSQNNRLIFTAKDKNAIRLQIKRELNIDPFDTEQLPDSRVDIAEFHDNEKLAKNPVSQDHILVNCPTGTVQLNNQKIHLHSDIIPGVGFMPIASSINQISHDALVVVENLAIMQLCSQFTLPALCQNALWLYRGDHKSGAKAEACYDLLNRFGQDKEVIVFSDMDPKGLEIALTIPHAKYWLGPEMTQWTRCLQSDYASRSGYDIQSKAMGYLLKLKEKRNLSITITDLISQMQREQSSYRQEHMFAHHVTLSLFTLLYNS